MTESSTRWLDTNDSPTKARTRWWAYAGVGLLPAMLIASSSLFSAPARAVPSFTDQTGMPCQSCHVGGFGPQLTPFGREFKLGGYTMRTKASVPLSAMALASFTHTRADQNPPPDRFKANDNLSFDQGSLFVAGGAGNHFGGFAQITYDGVEKHWAWDNLDVRAVTTGQIFGQDAIFGLTLNNGPTIQDAWNTTPAWGFPYTDTTLSQTPDAAPLIDGGLAQGVLGLSAYSWIGQTAYVELGGYVSPSAGTLGWLGADPASPGSIHGVAPYARLAVQRSLGGGTFEVGAFALKAAIFPGRDQTSGYSDRYTDIGLDSSWLRELSNGDTITANVRYVHESSNLRASCALALIGDGSDANCAKGHLNEIRGDVTYSWRNKVDLTLGGFSIAGSSNPDLYDGPDASPDSNGVMAELDYTPWGTGNSPLGNRANMRLGLQYTAYGKFNGAKHNYDGSGANASDNNVLRAFTWVAF